MNNTITPSQDKELRGRDDFYGTSILGGPVKDPFKYRGRGRPRKADYSTLEEIQIHVNRVRNERLDKYSREVGK